MNNCPLTFLETLLKDPPAHRWITQDPGNLNCVIVARRSHQAKERKHGNHK